MHFFDHSQKRSRLTEKAKKVTFQYFFQIDVNGGKKLFFKKTIRGTYRGFIQVSKTPLLFAVTLLVHEISRIKDKRVTFHSTADISGTNCPTEPVHIAI